MTIKTEEELRKERATHNTLMAPIKKEPKKPESECEREMYTILRVVHTKQIVRLTELATKIEYNMLAAGDIPKTGEAPIKVMERRFQFISAAIQKHYEHIQNLNNLLRPTKQ